MIRDRSERKLTFSRNKNLIISTLCFLTTLMDIFNCYVCSFLGPCRLGQIGNFLSENGKNILFGIGNEAEFGPKFA